MWLAWTSLLLLGIQWCANAINIQFIPVISYKMPNDTLFYVANRKRYPSEQTNTFWICQTVLYLICYSSSNWSTFFPFFFSYKFFINKYKIVQGIDGTNRKTLFQGKSKKLKVWNMKYDWIVLCNPSLFAFTIILDIPNPSVFNGTLFTHSQTGLFFGKNLK